MKWFAIHFTHGLVGFILILSIIVVGGTNPALAGEDPGDLFNYSFGVWLGSGVYKVNDADKKFAVLRVPSAYTLRPVQSDQSAPIDRLGFRLLLPAVIGYEQETDTNFNYGAVAFVPGTVQYIYGGGFRSLVSIPWQKFVFGIGNSLVLAGDRDASSNDTSGFSMVNAGLDIRHPTNWTLFDRQLDISGYFIINYFKNDVDILSDDGSTSKINTIYDVGLTFGVSQAVSIWVVDIDRVGIDYRWGDEGFQGIGFNLGFPF